MIIVSGSFQFAPEHLERVRDEMSRVEGATRAEAGCRTYAFYVDRDDPCRFRVYEEWDSWQALDAHGGSAHIAAYRAALAEIGLLQSEVRAFEVGEPREL